jgi:hypothetical protein
MPRTGRTGADAIFIALDKICRVVTRYQNKLSNVIDLAVTEGAITAGQAVTAHAFVASVSGACAIFELIAQISGFDTNP